LEPPEVVLFTVPMKFSPIDSAPNGRPRLLQVIVYEEQLPARTFDDSNADRYSIIE
jgi:hypothetical protein